MTKQLVMHVTLSLTAPNAITRLALEKCQGPRQAPGLGTAELGQYQRLRALLEGQPLGRVRTALALPAAAVELGGR